MAKRILIDLVGQKFGKLTVIARDNSRPNAIQAHWVCQCECGATTIRASRDVRTRPNQACKACHKAARAKNSVPKTPKRAPKVHSAMEITWKKKTQTATQWASEFGLDYTYFETLLKAHPLKNAMNLAVIKSNELQMPSAQLAR